MASSKTPAISTPSNVAPKITATLTGSTPTTAFFSIASSAGEENVYFCKTKEGYFMYLKESQIQASPGLVVF